MLRSGISDYSSHTVLSIKNKTGTRPPAIIETADVSGLSKCKALLLIEIRETKTSCSRLCRKSARELNRSFSGQHSKQWALEIFLIY